MSWSTHRLCKTYQAWTRRFILSSIIYCNIICRNNIPGAGKALGCRPWSGSVPQSAPSKWPGKANFGPMKGVSRSSRPQGAANRRNFAAPVGENSENTNSLGVERRGKID